MIQTIPFITKAVGALLLAGYMMVSGVINLTNAYSNEYSSPITSWNNHNQYQATIDNQQLIIYLEEESTDPPKPGKIKIIFKDDKSKGTTLVYEREIGGELTDQDQEYIERILTDVEHFHKENRTYNKMRDRLDNFWKGLRRNGK